MHLHTYAMLIVGVVFLYVFNGKPNSKIIDFISYGLLVLLVGLSILNNQTNKMNNASEVSDIIGLLILVVVPILQIYKKVL